MSRPNVALPVETNLKTFKYEVLHHPFVFTRHCLFRLLLAPIDGTWHHFTSYEDTKVWIDSLIAPRDEAFFRNGIHLIP
ncbi:hypothetical protein TNCV_680361 [Trichonephila clavipes]|nr:hypothetical protein TNCV_680361 [Trichonephila clavipes]